MLNATFESLADEEVGPIRCIHRRCEDFARDHAWHFHPQFELVWIICSEGTRFVGDSIERYHAGDLVLTGPNLAHCWRNDRESALSGDAEWIVLQFDPRSLGSDFMELPEAVDIRHLLAAARRGLHFHGEVDQALGDSLRSIMKLTGMRQLLKLGEILTMLSELPYNALAAETFIARSALDQRQVARLEQVQTYIANHFRGMASQSDIAAQLQMSPVAFSKFMRATTGRTFMSMLKLARINEACRLLASSSARVTDIALECGYQHTSHFDRHFQQIKGVSPSQYRDQMRMIRTDSRAME
jgi:AraC-like DNA-binding protein